MSCQYKVCPLFYGDERTLMNMGVFEELLNEGWQSRCGDFTCSCSITMNTSTSGGRNEQG